MNRKRVMIKKIIKKNKLSTSLQNNLKLRKQQISERDKNEIIGKRLTKIGVLRLDVNGEKEKK